MIKTCEFVIQTSNLPIDNQHPYWLVNGRYKIYTDGVIYDINGTDIPAYVFKKRDELVAQ